MIGIKVNDTFLELKPGTDAEVERKSPFFAINDVMAEVSTPITFKYTPGIALALGLPFQYYSQRLKKKYNAELFDGESFQCRCVLIIDSATLDLNHVENASISGFVLYGVSEFFQTIKGIYLKHLNLGGTRTFGWTTNNPTDTSNGFWQHLHDTWTNNLIPYVFCPVRNEYSVGGFINQLATNGTLQYDYFMPLAPMISVKYIIEQAITEQGWQVQWNINDPQFDRLLMLSIVPVNWLNKTFGFDPLTNTALDFYDPKPVIEIKLAEHVPQEKLLSDFLLQIFNRYGIAPLFNLVTKKCRLVAVKEVGKGPRKDWTPYAQPIIDSNFTEDDRVFAFANDIDSRDEYPSQPDFTGVKMLATVEHYADLPTPYAGNNESVCFVFHDNKYYQVNLKADETAYEWTFYADNIYDYEPVNTTDTISTTIAPLPSFLTKYRTVDGVDYFGWFPYIKHNALKDFGYRFMIYHGMVTETLTDGSNGLQQYPYASNSCLPPSGTPALQWSDVYNHEFNGHNYGIIPYWWQSFLHQLRRGEDPVMRFHLPRHVLQSFNWDDRILVHHLEYMVKSIIEPLPYKGFVQATMRRLKPANFVDPGVEPPTADIYAQLTVINIVTDYGGIGPYGTWTNYKTCDVMVTLYTDAAGTLPYNPPGAGVKVYVGGTILINGSPAGPASNTEFIITSPSQMVYHRIQYSGTSTVNGSVWTSNWYLNNDVNGVYVVI